MNQIRFITALLIFNFSFSIINAQVGINNDNTDPDASAMLDVKSTDKGLLIPRMSTTDRTNISSPANGLLVFDNTTNSFWFYKNNAWEELKGDDLGNHIANQNIQLNGQWISNDGDNEGIKITDNGNTEITGTPGFPLTLNSSIDQAVLRFKNADNSGWHMRLQGTGGKDLGFSETAQSDNRLVLHSGGKVSVGNDKFVVEQDGKVAIGTSTPDAKLHIVGEVKIVDGNQSLGKVLVSDANGLSTWTDPNIGLPVPDTASMIPIRYHGNYLYVHPTDNAANIDWATAQTTCSNLTAFSFSDWYLPTRLELDAMHKQSYLITGLSQITGTKYWSNTEQNSNIAYTQRLDYGGPDPDLKTDTVGHNCRCVRKK